MTSSSSRIKMTTCCSCSPTSSRRCARGKGVTNVYVTAGNGTGGVDKADIRYEGLRAAYGAAAGASDWKCGYIEIAGHTAEHCRLADKNVSLVFLGYPDGGKEGEQRDEPLAPLRGLDDERRDDRARRPPSYDRDDLIETSRRSCASPNRRTSTRSKSRRRTAAITPIT